MLVPRFLLVKPQSAWKKQKTEMDTEMDGGNRNTQAIIT